MSPLQEYETRTVEDENEEEVEMKCCKNSSSCNECPQCCNQILRRYNVLRCLPPPWSSIQISAYPVYHSGRS
uniref:Uncharacterized protein n=2 Tax=Anguilla anguilla TaxID=7936 RepID=A0A0E9QS66_ANGAN